MNPKPVKSYDHLLEMDDPGRHIVQFYGASERALIRNISLYLRAGLHRGDTVLALLSARRRVAVLRQLEALRVDTASSLAMKQLVIMNAEEVLPQVMEKGKPAWEAFSRSVGAIVHDLRPAQGYERLRAYGELVDLLWKSGRFADAIRLEEFWNRLRQMTPFQLFCAYGIAPSAAGARQILSVHTHEVASVH